MKCRDTYIVLWGVENRTTGLKQHAITETTKVLVELGVDADIIYIPWNELLGRKRADWWDMLGYARDVVQFMLDFKARETVRNQIHDVVHQCRERHVFPRIIFIGYSLGSLYLADFLSSLGATYWKYPQAEVSAVLLASPAFSKNLLIQAPFTRAQKIFQKVPFTWINVWSPQDKLSGPAKPGKLDKDVAILGIKHHEYNEYLFAGIRALVEDKK